MIPGVNEHFADHPALTAIGVMTRLFLGSRRADPNVRGGAELLIADLPECDSRALKVDMYYWYYASFALFQLDGPKGPYWRKWNQAIKGALLDSQNRRTDCRHGSWEPVDRWSCEGGRVYTTAVGALTLEVYYRYPNVVLDRPK